MVSVKQCKRHHAILSTVISLLLLGREPGSASPALVILAGKTLRTPGFAYKSQQMLHPLGCRGYFDVFSDGVRSVAARNA